VKSAQATLPAVDDARFELADVSRRVKAIFVGSIGNLVEWYDFYAYAAFALFFAGAFFPGSDPVVQQLNAAILFAFGFIVRPIGGWLFGHLADHYGRRNALMLSVLLMCFGSLMIAVTPTYASIGIAAPILLGVARTIQGLSLGGEYGTSATYLTEVAGEKHRGFYSSFQYVTLIGGQLCAILVLLLLQQVFLTTEQLRAWGWRIPFVVGALLAIVALFMRRNLHETDDFVAARAVRRSASSVRALLRYPREVFLVVGLTMGGTTAFYTYTTYMQKFLVNTSGFSRPTATMIMTIALVVFMLIQPWWGMAADRWGRKPMLYVFGFGGALVSVPIYSAISVVTAPLTALALVLVPLVILGSYTSISGLIKAELFPAHIRTLGVALPYAVGNTLFGGTAEYVALWFKQAGLESGFYWYLSAVIGMAAIGFVMLPETKTNSQILED